MAQLGGHEFGPKLYGSFALETEFQVASQEGMKDIEGKTDLQEKAFDGIALVLVNVIRMPGDDQFIESAIFDIPALVPELHHALGGNLGGG